MTTRLGPVATWLVGRWAQGRELEGRLLWVGQDGKVVDLGPATREQLLTLAWSSRVAYRLTKVRDEKARLARLKAWAADLSKNVATKLT